MKNVPNNFLQELTKNGRQIDAIITYQESGSTVTLDSDEIIAIKPMKKTQLLKSLMKECDIETSNPIPKDTQINIKIGLLLNSEYKYINLGNFIIYNEPEYNADTLSYTMKAYDKMLYSMVDYKDMQVTYPISVRDFINKICQKIGLTFKNANEEFANYDKMILVDSYTGYDYKIRDVLDELAQVTASIICINDETDELEIRYPNETNLTLNEDYLKDVNVEIKEKYGPINTITLSRGAEADNVYLDDLSSVIANGVCEIKIKDNQIMNFNDRSDYLPDILEKLKGLEYYIIDIESTGVMLLDIYDLFNLNIWGENYNCLLLNDELNIQDGISESIYNEIPEETETDYSKADKTDRRINQVYIIADKANKKIESVISEIGDRTDKKTTITQDVDSINSLVQNTVDITREEKGTKLILNNCMQGYLLELHIYGNNSVFKYLLASDNLFASNSLLTYGDSLVKITRQVKDEQGNITEVEEFIDLGITEVLRQKEDVFDEYVLLNNKAQIIRRIGVLESGETYILPKEKIEDLGEFKIELNEGTNTIEIVNYIANMMADYVIINDFTKMFATTVELNSAITQLANSINLTVSQKVDKKNIIADFNLGIENEQAVVSIHSNLFELFSDFTQITKEGKLTTTEGEIAGLIMTETENGSYLYKNYTVNGRIYQSGFFIPKTGNPNAAFLYAGVDITNGQAKLTDANTIIQHNGQITAKWFKVNGEDGFFYVEHNNGNKALVFKNYGIDKYLSNGNRWSYQGISYRNGVPSKEAVFLYDAQGFEIIDGLHENKTVFDAGYITEGCTCYYGLHVYGALELLGDDTNLITNAGRGVANAVNFIGASKTDSKLFFRLKDDTVASLNVSWSDKRLKKNIKETKIKSSLEIIRKFIFKSYDWIDGKLHKKIGLIAQDLEKIDKDLVIKIKQGKKSKYNYLYQLNTEELQMHSLKAIQELDKEVEGLKKENLQLKNQVKTQQKTIDFLLKKLNCKEELEEYLKGDKNGRK